VKVKRGLFSYLREEHLPSQNDHPNIKWPLAMQVIAKMTFVGNLEFQHPASPELFGANKCTFLHIDCRTLLYIRKQPQVEIRLSPSRSGRGYELPATVRSLPGRK
jgi:hypothetical protein